jgi:hypothetical protein
MGPIPVLRILVAVVIALAGIAEGSPLIAAAGLALLAFGLWRFNRERRLTRNLKRVERRGD